MIFPLLHPIQAARPAVVLPRRPGLADAAELRRARAFLDVAFTGLDPNEIVPPPERVTEPTITDATKNEYREYEFGAASLKVDAQGRVVSFSGSYSTKYDFPKDYPPGTVFKRQVSDTMAANIAQRVYTAAGWPETIHVEEVRDLAGENDTCVEVWYVPTAGGIPYVRRDYEDYMEINRLDGGVRLFAHLGDVPAPPLSLVPAGSPGDALLAALRVGAATGGTGRADPYGGAFQLRLWLPPASPLEPPAAIARRITDPRVRANAVARQAMLVYVGRVLLGPGRTADLVLDARTGEALKSEILDAATISPGLGGALPAVKAKPLPPFGGVRPWRVVGNGAWRAWSAPARTALAPVASALPIIGQPVVLSDGTLAISGTYDPKANLLGVSGKAYRPGPALADLLKRRAK